LTNSYLLPGYARLDAYAAYRTKVGPTRFTAQLNVNNVLDQRYFFGSPTSNYSEAFNQVAEPLTLLGSLRLAY
jgi:iron complex outermembrane receptor protein